MKKNHSDIDSPIVLTQKTVISNEKLAKITQKLKIYDFTSKAAFFYHNEIQDC